MSSHDSAHRFIERHEARLAAGTPIGRTRVPARVYFAPGDTALLRDVMLSHVRSTFGRTASVIFGAVRDEYGSVTERRLWRALAWLVENRKIEHLGTFRQGEYRRAR